MTWKQTLQSVFLFGIVFTASMCTSEVDDNTGELLIGRWELQEASRNGRITASLDDLYFEFYEDGSMRTNLSGGTETAKYKLDLPEIRQTESKMDAVYAIEEISDSMLLVNTELRGYSFRFLLAKSIPEQ
jgi:hypothetical protein